MRGKRTIINVAVSIIATFVSIICGLILPRLILSSYGSSYNGITSSISQFIGWTSLLQSGVISVTKAALYSPLKEKNQDMINGIIKATDLYMKKIGLIFVVILLGFSFGYPLFVKENFEYSFSFSLSLIIGSSTFFQYYFGTAYKTIISASQRQYVLNYIQIFTIIGNTIIASVLVAFDFDIRVVYAGSAIIYALNPIMCRLYAEYKFNIDKNVLPIPSAISQKKNAFAQKVANLVHSNTDIVLITIFLKDMKEVSVYTVYYMVVHAVSNLSASFFNSIDAALGDMLAKKENSILKKNFSYLEICLYSITTLFFSVTLSTILKFIKIYTAGVTDTQYIRPLFALLIVLVMYVYNLRLPYQLLVEAAGHFKETKMGAIIEASMNVILSLLLVTKYGISGVAFATLCSSLFRTVQYIYYTHKYILMGTVKNTIVNVLLSVFSFTTIFLLSQLIDFRVESYFMWAIFAGMVFLIGIIIITFMQLIFNRVSFFEVLRKIKNIVIKK